jgi:hypothetical protein
MTKAVALILLGLLGASQSSSDTAWFGVPLPPGIGDPHRPVVAVPSVQAGEEGARMLSDVATIVDFSKKSRTAGNGVWGRVTGFPGAASAMEWVAQQFKSAGLANVTVQRYNASAPMWWARRWDMTLLADDRFGAGTRDLVLESALPTSGSTLPQAITAAVILTGAVSDPLPPQPVKGRIAVQSLRPASGAYSERGATVKRAKELISRGALAVLNIVDQTGNMHVRDFGNCGGTCFNLGAADGAFLRAVVEQAEAQGAADAVRVRLTLRSEMLTGLKGHNVVGVIPGASDENIIVNAHADGWFDAAGDNADGLAVQLALARHFATADHRLARTLVFVASGGHHSTGLNGPANFVKMNAPITAKSVLVLNLEHVAQFAIDSATWTVGPDEQRMSFGISNEAPFLIELGRRGMERFGFRLNPAFTASVPGDLGGYAPLGVPRVQAIHSGPMYHTTGDVLETISPAGLERALAFFAFFITEAAAAPRTLLRPDTVAR